MFRPLGFVTGIAKRPMLRGALLSPYLGCACARLCVAVPLPVAV